MEKQYTLRTRRPESEIEDVKLLGNSLPDSERVMWVSDCETVKNLIKSGNCPEGMHFACSGSDDELKDIAQKNRIDIRFFKEAVTPLFERLISEKLRHVRWALVLQEATVRNYSMRDVITTCANKIIDGSAFFVDMDYRVSYMGGSRCLDNAMAKELLNDGTISSVKLKKILDKLPNNHISVKQMDNGEFSWIGKIELENTQSFMVFMFTENDEPKSEIGLLFYMLTECFQNINLHRKHGEIPFGDFTALMNNMISGKMTGWDEIDAYMKRLPDPPKRYISIGVVEANPSLRRTSVNALVSKLKTLFPGCSAAQVGDIVILMISSDTKENQPRPQFSEAAMNVILTEYDAHVAFANATQRLDMIRTEYLLAESTLKLARALREQGNARIFYYEDYAEYIYIDLLMERFRELMVHDDLLFLTTPDAVEIYRYDQIHGTDLQLVLYQYCKHNGNISAAAKDSYMHRNTFAARMQQIKEILKNVDLTDGRVQQRMLSSCRVFRYYNFYYDKKSAQSLSERLSITLKQRVMTGISEE